MAIPLIRPTHFFKMMKVLTKRCGIDLILSMKDGMCMSDIFRASYISMRSVRKKIFLLEKYNLLRTVKGRKKRKVFLTCKGQELKRRVRELVTVLNSVKQ